MTSVGLRWEELLMPLLQKYKLNITWGDQDLLNIIFHHNPGKAAYLYTCSLHCCVPCFVLMYFRRPNTFARGLQKNNSPLANIGIFAYILLSVFVFVFIICTVLS